jgi:hypothetical protein
MRVKLRELLQALKARNSKAQGGGRGAVQALGYKNEMKSPARTEQFVKSEEKPVPRISGLVPGIQGPRLHCPAPSWLKADSAFFQVPLRGPKS